MSIFVRYANKINLIWIFSPSDFSPEIDIEMKTNTEDKYSVSVGVESVH